MIIYECCKCIISFKVRIIYNIMQCSTMQKYEHLSKSNGDRVYMVYKH